MDADLCARRFANLFHQVFLRFHQRPEAGDHHLSFEAVAVLEHLERTGPLSIQESADHFGRSQAAASEILARLERRGLVSRYPDERDRRRHLVWFTPEGLSELERSRRVLSMDLLARALESLESSEREGVLDALNRLLKAAPDPTEGGAAQSPDPKKP